jgi:hypothetical protein
MLYYSNISDRDYLKAAHELTREENDRDRAVREAAISNAKLEQADADREYIDFMQEAVAEQAEANKFFNRVKNSLLSEAIYKIYKESFVTPMTKEMKVISKNIVNRFIAENGAQNLLNNFRTKNILLSEVNRIVTKTYNEIVQECEGSKCGQFIVPDNIKDGFFDELEDLDTDDACKLIKDRVADSINEFMDSNTLAKIEYQEILNNAQDHINNMNDRDANAEIKAQESAAIAQREIQEMELRREKNILHCIVQKLSEAALKDEDLKKIYTEGSKLDMDKIVDHSQLFLNLLEMVNTTEMIKVDEDYMNNYINSLSF